MPKSRTLSIFASCLLVVTASVGCRDRASETVADGQPSAADPVTSAATRDTPVIANIHQREWVEQVRGEIESFCADCHVMPMPSSSIRSDWVAEVDQGFMLYTLSGRSDLKVPDRDDVITFFKAQAPRKFDWSPWFEKDPPCDIPFDQQGFGLTAPGESRPRPPGIANIRWLDIGISDSPALVYCDIGTGAVVAHWPQKDGGITKQLATLFQPVHVEACDLDDDGHQDLVVADIGEFDANDSNLGRVVWLRRDPDSEEFQQIVLVDGLGRVADVQPADFDGDGDIDLMVAEFGWRNSGRIVMLENNLSAAGDAIDPANISANDFLPHVVDDRHGTIHVPAADLNGDGHMDFVALISQGHETVEAFLNDGEGGFQRKVIFQAPDPAYGSSGLQLVDMDLDDDLDVLFTNGDSFDRGIKPYHAVGWLENDGSYPYEHHQLCEMPGVLTAKAADFDGDGDMDVVAGSLIAGPVGDHVGELHMASILMLIQTEPGVFKKTSLQQSIHQHASIEVADFDNDGAVDFAISNLLRENGNNEPDGVIWWNQSPTR
ncbi:FG-GAP repeat protein [Rubripirellula lacrimiformis]|uniref:FG-GAP repeat protein n=1 Tax=Rubripirellula lacrimiformis TaxID=1930273 RepID=A0A517NHM2_9BACT|nr:VCBS repeat-containing protein [Rubripirellula lacrimiformis]QDT06630.1 FG-GAP repeat protein [Rubripirellula lacrimiformis]